MSKVGHKEVPGKAKVCKGNVIRQYFTTIPIMALSYKWTMKVKRVEGAQYQQSGDKCEVAMDEQQGTVANQADFDLR